MQFLRENRIGSANFFALDKVKNWEKNYKENWKEIPKTIRIFDIFKFQNSDPQILSLFYQTFRNSLIAQDLNVAKNIAFNSNLRCKLVTYQGVMIDE